jgi:acetyl-CoA carboxylase biotin carboxyl carrier protein
MSSPDTTAMPEPPGLVQVREQVVELLARLDRPPRTLRLTAGEVTLDIDWADAAQGVVPAAPGSPPVTAGDTVYLRSPAVGVFYHASEPGADPFVSVGSVVRPGDQIGIVEAMKLMMPVEATRAGRITAVVKGDGETVEFDEPLFALTEEEV